MNKIYLKLITFYNSCARVFKKYMPSKRKLIQLYAALLTNANIKGYGSGSIYKGGSKGICVPSLNCYSCPGATGACPIGSLQSALSASKTTAPTYVIGIILLYSITFGRMVCGYLCPAGLFQELLYKIKTPKLRKSMFTRALSYLKYLILFVLVIFLPLVFTNTINLPVPTFCKYICPSGTIGGSLLLLVNQNNKEYYSILGPLFTWKMSLAIVFIVLSIFIFRFFCRFLCPLGALYGLFNRIAILGIKIDKAKCTSCNACVNTCKMDVKEVGDSECINCGECRKVCPAKCISYKGEELIKLVRGDKKQEKEVVNTEVKEEIDEKMTYKPINKRKVIYYSTLTTVLTGILVGALIYHNYPRDTIYQINDTCNDLSFTLNDNSTYRISDDKNVKLLYFTTQFNDEKSNSLSSYYQDTQSLSIIIFTEDVSLSDDHLKFSSSIDKLSLFTEETDIEEYSIVLDKENKIILKEEGFIDQNEYDSTIYPCIQGVEIGNQVGNLCINKDINLVNNHQGEVFSRSRYKGKVVIINFWYIGCVGCEAEMPHFDEVYKKYADSIEVIAIHQAGRKVEDINKHINKYWSDFTIKFGIDDSVSPFYTTLGGSDTWPYTVILDQDGIIRFIHRDSLNVEKLENSITSLI